MNDAMNDFSTEPDSASDSSPGMSTEFLFQYPVSVWETIGIAAGAALLTAIGLAGLGVKVLNNSFYPERAEAIARSIITYDIPGGSRGVFGTNLGGARVAVVAGKAFPQGMATPTSEELPAIELLVAQVPVSQETEEIERQATSEFFSGFSFSYQSLEAFQVQSTETQHRQFCGGTAPVLVREGTLTLADQTTRVPAVKYEVNVDRQQNNFIAILVTVGQEAEKNAETVFQTLRCTAGSN